MARNIAQRIQATKDTWSALPEVDALLAQLRQDHNGIREAVRGMTVVDIAVFRQQLDALYNTLYDIGCDRIHADAGRPEPLPRRYPLDQDESEHPS